MATNTNTSSDAIVISSSDEASDSDSTDYEPEPKKCKLGVGSGGVEGAENTHLAETNSLVSIPIRAATNAVVEYANQMNGNHNHEESRSRTNLAGAFSGHSGIGGMGERASFFTVGDLVSQTLEASLGRIPSRHSSPLRLITPQGSHRSDHPRESGISQAIGISTPPDAPTSNPRVVISIPPSSAATASAGDFPTIAREVVVRMDGGTGSASQSQRRPRRRRRSGRRRNRGDTPNENDNTQPDQDFVSGSSSSYSSSEYFTDDVDPMEIPSDEYLSPPFPTRQGQRRNAIFVRRDPPTAALVPNEDDQYYHNELEVASVLDINENPIEDGSSTSGVDDELLRRSPVEPFLDLPPDETDNNFADNETVKSDVEGDSEPLEPTSCNSKGQNASEGDSEMDKSLCSQCRSQKAEPFFRYCLRCFKIRRTWLPQRPPSRRLKSRKALMRNSNPNSLNNSTNSTRTTRSSETSEGEDVVDGGPSASQSHQVPSTSPPPTTPPVDNTIPGSSSQVQRSLPFSQPIDMNEGFLVDENNPSTNRLMPDTQPGNLTLMEIFTQPEAYSGATCPTEEATTTATTAATANVNSQSQSGSSSSSQSQCSLFSMSSQNSYGTLASAPSSSPPSQPQQSSSPLPKNGTNDIIPALSSQCSVCCVRDKDAAFVHNKIAHLYCCYTCADKILKKNGRCPICRERVLRVVKIINV